jgi:hypothetical protein
MLTAKEARARLRRQQDVDNTAQVMPLIEAAVRAGEASVRVGECLMTHATEGQLTRLGYSVERYYESPGGMPWAPNLRPSRAWWVVSW